MSFDDQLALWLRGDAEALNFALMAWEAAQQWDDLHDEGRCAEPDALLGWLAFGKEADPFFVRHSGILRGAMLVMFLSWTAANELERGAGDDVAKAWVLRAAYYALVQAMAWCVGGHDWAVQVGPEIWRAYGESLAEFQQEMADA